MCRKVKKMMLQTMSQLGLKIAPVKRARSGNVSVYSVVVFLLVPGNFVRVAMTLFLVVLTHMI